MDIYVGALIIVGVILDVIFIAYDYKKARLASVIFKGLSSACFVLLGLLLYSRSAGGSFALPVLTGLFLGALGDVLLHLKYLCPKRGESVFAAGIAAFLLGHLAYLAALCIRDAGCMLIGLPLGAIISALAIPPVLRRLQVPKKLLGFGVVYIAVVIIMFACAAGAFIRAPGSSAMLLFSVGAALFMVSDILLVFFLFAETTPKPLRAFNLSFYYVGQVLIALSLI